MCKVQEMGGGFGIWEYTYARKGLSGDRGNKKIWSCWKISRGCRILLVEGSVNLDVLRVSQFCRHMACDPQ